MDPLYALPLQPAPVFGRSTNFEYKKTLPDTVFNSQAPSQRHVFRWQNQAAEWWIPEQSYLRIRWKLGKCLANTGTLLPISMADGVAPIMNFCPAMFSRIEYYMDGNKLSDLQDYIPQIDTMSRRTRESKSFQSAISDRQAFMSPNFIDRQRLICEPQASDNLPASILLTSDSKLFPNAGAMITRNPIGSVTQPPESFPWWYVQEDNKQYLNLFFINVSKLTYDLYQGLIASDFDTSQYSSGFRTLLGLVGIPLLFSSASVTDSYCKIGPNQFGLPRGVFKIIGTVENNIGHTVGLKLSLVNSVVNKQSFAVALKADIKVISGDANMVVDMKGSNENPSPLVLTLNDFIQAWNTPDVHARLSVRIEIVRAEASSQVMGSSRQETLWVPPLGIFKIGHAIPTTRHELHLVIPNDYMKRALEFGFLGYGDGNTVDDLLWQPGAQTPTTTKFRLEIESMEFFAAMVMGPRADDAKFVLDLTELRMSPLSIPSDTVTQTQTYPFNLSPNSSRIAVALQSGAVGNGIMSLTKFHLPTVDSLSGGETAFARFYVNFAGQNRPREENESELLGNLPFPSEFNSMENGKQFFSQRYLETMWNSGLISSQGGCETFEEWLSRGAFYHWNWPRDGGDLSTRFHVFLQLKTGASDEGKQIVGNGYELLINGKPNIVTILVFDVVARPFMISIRNGNVITAETSDAIVPEGIRRIRL